MVFWKSCSFEDIRTDALTHCFEPRSVDAIRAALGARRPLLVRGEPGVGKSQLAYAAAHALKRPIVSTVVTSRTEAQDLLFRFDAVARLGQAQVLACEAGHSGSEPIERVSQLLDEKRFVQPGPLWWVFDWAGAEAQWKRAAIRGARPDLPPEAKDWTVRDGVVLLIDEIDKADTDVPNGLLECLGHERFSVPYFDEPVRSDPRNQAPLIVITTNEEKELPAAFVRRCLVLGLGLPQDDELTDFLVRRGKAHFNTRISGAVYKETAQLLVQERKDLDIDEPVRPGQAEYLDILRAILEIGGTDPAAQMVELDRVKDFSLKKQAPTDG